MNRPVAQLLLATLLTVALVATAQAKPDFATAKAAGADALLKATDDAGSRYDNAQWDFKMTVKPTSGEAKSLEFKVWQKGKSRLVRFTAPGPIKGLSMLSKGTKVMYVYSPETDNVRRVAASARRQTLLGSNLTYSDMQSAPFSETYTAAFDKEEGNHQWLKLTKKADTNVAWDTLRVRVDKAKLLVDTIEYLEGSTVARTQTRTAYKADLGGAPAYTKVSMTSADGLVTTLDMVAQDATVSLDKSLFKKKNLIRGN